MCAIEIFTHKWKISDSQRADTSAGQMRLHKESILLPCPRDHLGGLLEARTPDLVLIRFGAGQ